MRQRLALLLFVMTLLALPLSRSGWAQPFGVAPANASFPGPSGLAFGSIEWADFNADGFLDMALVGRLPGGFDPLYGRIFRSSGPIVPDQIPTPPPSFSFSGIVETEALWLSDLAWGDFDGDGDLDLFFCGARSLDAPYDPVADVLTYEGGTTFTPRGFAEDVRSCAGAWGDLDNDGHPDLVVIGALASGEPVTYVYRNAAATDGRTLALGAELPGVASGDVTLEDVDLDGDLDVLATGIDAQEQFVTYLYRNDGDLAFSRLGELPGLAYSSASWADYDADGDPDLLLTGATLGPLIMESEGYLLQNDGTGSFSAVESGITPIFYGATRWFDAGNDGDLDVIASGLRQVFGGTSTSLYINEGGLPLQGRSVPVSGFGASPVPGLGYTALSWGDYDRDFDEDLLIAGDQGGEDDFTSRLYPNLEERRNTIPSTPTGLRVETGLNGQVTFVWEAASDAETPGAALTYNLRVGTSPGAGDVMPAMSVPGRVEIPSSNSQEPPTLIQENGLRQVWARGNVRQNTRWTLTLPPGTYYWTVQALDANHQASLFAEEQRIVVVL